MDKAAIKKVFKPLIKECIREVLMEHGLSSMLQEAVAAPVAAPRQQVQKQTPTQKQPEQKQQINEARKAMLEGIGKSGYLNSRFDPFSNTKALTESQASDGAAGSGPLAGIDPNDPGIDISGFMNGNANKWKALVGGKG